MIPFFVGYAMVVWYFTCKWRRSWRAIGVILAGLAGLVLVNLGHYELGQHFDINLPVLRSIMYPYCAMVVIVGGYIALLPLSHPPGFCGRCGYSLDGITEEATRCPECGKLFEWAAQPRFRPSGARRESLATTDVRSPAEHAVHDAAEQDERGQPGDQHPAHRRELPGRHRVDDRDRAGLRRRGDELVLPGQPQD